MNAERIKEVFSDEAFVKELFSKETPEEVQNLLAEKEIDLTIEEIVNFKEQLVKKLQQGEDSEELGDEDLEDVSGGCALLVTVVGLVALGSYLALEATMQDRW